MPHPSHFTVSPPYYTVVFVRVRQQTVNRFTAGDSAEGEAPPYEAIATRMLALAQEQPGYLGEDSASAENGLGITVSYWEDEASILAWKANAEHALAQAFGRSDYYAAYTVRVARVERAYGFGLETDPPT